MQTVLDIPPVLMLHVTELMKETVYGIFSEKCLRVAVRGKVSQDVSIHKREVERFLM